MLQLLAILSAAIGSVAAAGGIVLAGAVARLALRYRKAREEAVQEMVKTQLEAQREAVENLRRAMEQGKYGNADLWRVDEVLKASGDLADVGSTQRIREQTNLLRGLVSGLRQAS